MFIKLLLTAVFVTIGIACFVIEGWKSVEVQAMCIGASVVALGIIYFTDEIIVTTKPKYLTDEEMKSAINVDVFIRHEGEIVHFIEVYTFPQKYSYVATIVNMDDCDNIDIRTGPAIDSVHLSGLNIYQRGYSKAKPEDLALLGAVRSKQIDGSVPVSMILDSAGKK
jgi:hypothetical protein